MSKRSASKSTILPLPSSPHWAPMTAMTIVRRPEIRGQRSELNTQKARLRSKQNRKPRLSFPKLCGGGSAHVLVEHARDRLFGGCTHHALFLPAVLKKNQRGNAFDSVALGHRRVIVNIQFHDGRGARVFLGHGFNRGRQRAAWLAPNGPEVHQNRTIRFQDISFKRAVTRLFHMLTHELGSLIYLTVFVLARDF